MSLFEKYLDDNADFSVSMVEIEEHNVNHSVCSNFNSALNNVEENQQVVLHHLESETSCIVE